MWAQFPGIPRIRSNEQSGTLKNKKWKEEIQLRDFLERKNKEILEIVIISIIHNKVEHYMQVALFAFHLAGGIRSPSAQCSSIFITSFALLHM